MAQSYDIQTLKFKQNTTVSYYEDVDSSVYPPIKTWKSAQSTLKVDYGEVRAFKQSFVTADWKARLKAGTLVLSLKPLPYKTYKVNRIGFGDGGSWDPAPSSMWNGAGKLVQTTDNRVSWYLAITGEYMNPPDIATYIAKARTIAVTKLLNKVKDSKVNLAQAYAESAQVHSLIADTTVKLARVFQHLRKGQLLPAAQVLGLRVGKREAARYKTRAAKAKDPASVENLMANGVLSLQYGLKPLISDVIGLAELVAQKAQREIVAIADASHKMVFDESKVKSQTSSWNAYSPYKVTGSCQSLINVKVKLGVRYTKGNEVVHTAAQMGMSNIPLLGWELLPWSFVIDWFIPIGNYLSTLDATNGLVFESGYESSKCTVMHTRRQVVSGGVSATSSSSYSSEHFERIVLSAFPQAKFPSFKNPLSIEHAINAIALLVGVKNKIISDAHRI